MVTKIEKTTKETPTKYGTEAKIRIIAEALIETQLNPRGEISPDTREKLEEIAGGD